MPRFRYSEQSAQKINNYNPIDDILDAIDIKYIESYLRKKKLEKLNKK